MWKCIAPGQRTRAGYPGPGARGERRCCQSGLHDHPASTSPSASPFRRWKTDIVGRDCALEAAAKLAIERTQQVATGQERGKKIHPPRRLARDIYSSVRTPPVHTIAVVPFFFSLSLYSLSHTTLTHPSMRRQKKVASLHPSIPSQFQLCPHSHAC